MIFIVTKIDKLFVFPQEVISFFFIMVLPLKN